MGALVILAAIIDLRLGGALDTAMFIAYAAYIGGPPPRQSAFTLGKARQKTF